MPLHLNITVCCLLLLLSLSVVPASSFTHNSQLISVRSTTPSDRENTTQPGRNTPQLVRTKLGLAAAFFFTVLLACGLPILCIDWLQKSTSSQVASTVNRRAGVGPSLTSQGHSNTSIGRETEDLLTGQPLQGYPGRRRPRLSVGSDGDAVTSIGDTADTNQQEHVRPSREMWSLRNCSPPTDCRRRGERRRHLLKMWLSRCNCFAAGVFLSSGFMELYPDVEEAIDHAVQLLEIKTNFPFAPFLTLVGFFLVLSIEQIVLTVKSRQTSHDTAAAVQPTDALHTEIANHSSSHSSPANSDEENKVSPQSENNVNVFELDDLECSSPTRLLPPASPAVTFKGQLSSRLGGEQTEHGHDHFSGMLTETNSFASVLRVILLLCAMSLHSLFEGLAVGLQTSVTRSVSLFSAILLHKLIIAVGIGFNLATMLGTVSDHRHCEEREQAGGEDGKVGESSSSFSARSSKHPVLQQMLGTLILASSSPVGVGIGIVLTSVQQSSALMLTTAILQGFACGTFFYVVFCELLPGEFREGVSDRLGKLLFLVLGFLVIACYAVAMPE